jgi:hypothetical protein
MPASKFMLVGRRRVRLPLARRVTAMRPVTCASEGGVKSCGTEISSPWASFFSAS